MATQLLAVANTPLSSGEFSLASGETTIIALKGNSEGASMSADAEVVIELKDDANAWQAIGEVAALTPQLVSGPGTFRVTRKAGVTCGAFRG